MNNMIITLTPSFRSGLWKSWVLEAVRNVRSINYPSTKPPTSPSTKVDARRCIALSIGLGSYLVSLYYEAG